LESSKRPSGRGSFIFPNPKTDKPFQSIDYSWDTARKQAGLDVLRMRDLRHSFAAFLMDGGGNLYEVQQRLGHSNRQISRLNECS
jgi:integrase